MIPISGIVFFSILLLAALGVPIAKKFLRGLAKGADLYVIFDVDGRTVAFKNPGRSFPEGKPLEVIPTEIFTSDLYETYYNVCRFDGDGTLNRCEHPFHRTSEAAAHCKLNTTEHSFIGRVLEER